MTTDRNLLFGTLAFQNEYINLAQFAAVCRAWAATKSRPLAELLVERGWIDAQAKTELDRLVARKIMRYGGDERVTLGAVADTLVRDAIRDVEDQDVRLTVTKLPPAAGHVLIETLVKPSENRSRYTLSRLHGQGGLGKVWVARDGDLNREVALKELRPEHGRRHDVARRFLVEAQVTGQLEHPNIVPVYELARRPEDDQPFYTMRFVRGQTLRDAIEDYHRRRAGCNADPLELPRLLNAFTSVCNAIAYAHSRGVVHRDLKPENVVLGGFGEVMVLDWGLAKIIGQETSPYAETVDVPVAVSEKLSSDLTQAGRVMGTPAYMAPEQAEGRTELVDSRTDVYGLGAILYEILTGRPPHEDKDTAALLSRIASGVTPRVRATAPHVAPALDAICAKAMAKERSDRYLQATDLAADVQRWLADEPVSCYAEPWPARAARWARRHRTAAQSAAAVLVAVALVAVVAAIWVNDARQRESAAKRQAQQFGDGFRKATDGLLTVVGTDLKNVPGGQSVRTGLLEQAAAAYEEFYNANEFDPQMKMEWGWALTRLSRAQLEIGDYRGAEQNVRKAESIFASLSDSARDDSDRQYALATSRVDLALILADLGRLAGSGHLGTAEKTLRDAMVVYEGLETRSPVSSRFRAALAATLVHLGNTLRERLQFAEAETQLRRAVEKYENLVDAEPGDPQHRVGLATSYKSLGELLRAAGKPDAIDALRHAIQESQALVNILPDVPEYQERLASSRLDFGQQLYDLGQWRDAAQFYEAAVEGFDGLAAVDPEVVRYHEGLATAWNNRAVVLRALGDYVAAEAAIKLALDEYTSLLKFHPEAIDHHLGLAASRTSFGQLLRDMGRNRDAAEAFQSTIGVYQALPSEWHEQPAIQHGVAVARGNLAWTLFKLDQKSDAEEALRTAISNTRELVANNPSVPGFAEAQAWRLTRLGDVLFDAGRPDDALLAYREARQLRERLARELPHVADHQYKLAWLLTTCWDERMCDPDAAVVFAKHAVELAPENDTYQTALGAALVAAKDYTAAVEAIEKSMTLRASGDPITRLCLALARHALGQPDEARDCFDQACRAINQSRPDDPELLRLRASVATVLGVQP
jgi:serine/threonine-protein kinase